MHIRPFNTIFDYNKTNILGIYKFKVGNKNTRNIRNMRNTERYLKLKLTVQSSNLITLKVGKKFPRATLSNGVLLPLLLTLNVFLTWLYFFIDDFEYYMTNGNVVCAF